MTNLEEKVRANFIFRIGNSIFLDLYKEIKSIPFRGIKNVSYLTAGNVGVQLISIIGFIYIARMLGAKSYGVYLTVTTFVGMFDLLLLEGINKAVMREGSKDLAKMHAHLEKTIGLRNSLIVVSIIICILSSFFAPYDGRTRIYILLFCTQLIFMGLTGFLSTIFQASEKMRYIPLFGIFNRVLFLGLSIGLLSLGFGLTSVFLTALFSNFVTLVLSFRTSQKIVKFAFFSRVQIDKKILVPGLIFSLSGFLMYLCTRVDILMISWLGTSTDVGVYGVAFRIAEQGVMVRNMAATAFFPIFIKRFHFGKFQGIRLVRISIFFFIGVILAAYLASLFVEELVTILFGPEYKASGVILKVLIFYVAFAWANLPFTTAAQAVHLEKYLLITTAISAVLNVALNYVFFLRFGLIGIAYSTLVVYFVGSILVSLLCYKLMKHKGYLS